MAFVFAILGAIIGSFAGVVAERLHTGESWVTARSRCNSCGIALGAVDLVPILSWLLSRGRCRSCGSTVPAVYLVIETTLALLFALSYLMIGLTVSLAFFLSALVTLTVIVLYDLRHMIVPKSASLVLVLLSAVYALLSYEMVNTFLVAFLIGAGFFLAYVLSRGRVMGLGDAPVAFALSLLVGSQAVSGLLFSFWIGAVLGIVILVGRPKGARMGVEVPFVPFLAAGYLLAFFTSWNPLGFVVGY